MVCSWKTYKSVPREQWHFYGYSSDPCERIRKVNAVSIYYKMLYWIIPVYLFCSIALYLHWMFSSFKQSFDKPVGQFLLLSCKKQIARRFAYSDNVCFHYAQHTASKTNTLSNYLQRFTNTSILIQRRKLRFYQLATPNSILRFVLLSSKIYWKYESHFVMEILMKNFTV